MLILPNIIVSIFRCYFEHDLVSPVPHSQGLKDHIYAIFYSYFSDKLKGETSSKDKELIY